MDDNRPPSPPPFLDAPEHKYDLFYNAVQTLVNALGGYEDIESPPGSGHFDTIYRPGDSVLGVLKDLKKLWRKDDEDDERTVARCMAQAGLMKELVAILVECADRGEWGRKVSLVACDLIAALTWPIDVAQELKEIEEEGPIITDYASLLRAQMEYKALFLKSDRPLRALLALMVPCLAKPRKDEKDTRIISLGLHVVRNLLAVKDASAEGTATGTKAEMAQLQSDLICQLDSLTYLQLFLTLASCSDKSDLNAFNVIVLDILHLIFRGVKVQELGQDQKRVPLDNLAKLLDGEKKQKAMSSKSGYTRHSRFGTTITVKTAEQRVVLHKQNAVVQDAGKILDAVKKGKKAPPKKMDELTQYITLSVEAMIVLQNFCRAFLETAFNTFFEYILRDIRMERTKIRPSDNIRVFYLTRFFIEYLLLLRNKLYDKGGSRERDELPLGLVAQMAEMDSVKWLFARLRISWDDKPKAWTELQACIDCFTQILLLIDDMATSPDEEDVEVAEIMQHQLYYNYDILDSALSVVREYKNQSIAYLDSIIHFAYVLLRMLERYSKTKSFMFIRKRKNTHRKRKEQQVDPNDSEEVRRRNIPEEYGNEEEADQGPDQDAPTYEEHAFTFQGFEKRFATEAIVNTLLVYLERFLEFDSAEQVKRVVGLMHRQVVKTHAEGLFYKVTTMILFQRILENKHALPDAPASRDLTTLITFILRKFFKHVEKDPYIIIEVLSTKARGKWRGGGGESDDDGMGGQKSRIKEKMGPAELAFVKKHNLSWSKQMSVVFAILHEAGQGYLIKWIIGVLEEVLAARQEIVLATDGGMDVDEDEDGNVRARNFGGPSEEAKSKFVQYDLQPEDDEQTAAIQKNQHFRLMLKLLSFDIPPPPTELDFEEDISPEQLAAAVKKSNYAWHIPEDVVPSNLEASIGALKQYMEDPPSLDEDPKKLLRRKPRAPRRRRRSPSVQSYDSETGEVRESTRDSRPKNNARRKKAKKAAETQTFKSAAFIEDSDDEDEEATRRFFENEAKLRAEMDALAANGGHSMLDRGVKRKRGAGKGKGKKGKSLEIVDSEDEGLPLPSSTPMNDDVEPESDRGEHGATTRIVTEEEIAAMNRRKETLADMRRMAMESDEELGDSGSDEDHEGRSMRPVVHSSESGMPIFEEAGDDEDDDEVRAPRASARRVVMDSDEDDD
ncbi:topoisomerase 1-associated factor 1 [Cryptococcus wingfieldii CBS 7118]|uniref:Topoisomerase 1-associated factor 1 n=1 Tax=Cryptococcus wingfieldii CBS 7118 TaxID=1295528 RepID=A0A1E3JZ93_9TREE|nr:topoisomerase 1-associated factor 1 [Cryptococcus wingfieldii CBS 7118]ODO06093.1 topoisomerase 1-associated factor 1 [Cryptococcus wingfieldii CBS 7118]